MYIAQDSGTFAILSFAVSTFRKSFPSSSPGSINFDIKLYWLVALSQSANGVLLGFTTEIEKHMARKNNLFV